MSYQQTHSNQKLKSIFDSAWQTRELVSTNSSSATLQTKPELLSLVVHAIFIQLGFLYLGTGVDHWATPIRPPSSSDSVTISSSSDPSSSNIYSPHPQIIRRLAQNWYEND